MYTLTSTAFYTGIGSGHKQNSHSNSNIFTVFSLPNHSPNSSHIVSNIWYHKENTAYFLFKQTFDWGIEREAETYGHMDIAVYDAKN